MKLLTRLVLPLLLVTTCILFLLNYDHPYPRIQYLLWPLAILLFPFAMSVCIYLIQVIKPDLIKTDFRPWYWRSYRDLSEEFSDCLHFEPHTHRLAAGTLGAIFFILIVGGAIGTLPIQKRYVDRHLLKHGLSTRAIILKYTPPKLGKYYRHRPSNRAKADIRFVTNMGKTVTYRVEPLGEYHTGDSVTVNYSSEDPSFCEIEEGQWRLY